ncbi:MAG TPA: energy transducer TonB [bacterium]|nr:energy transducer TonB [bacterium]HOL35258.1 energy transducer TonB [bacterium]HPP08717.1 energy transducer TonB [bacterium]
MHGFIFVLLISPESTTISRTEGTIYFADIVELPTHDYYENEGLQDEDNFSSSRFSGSKDYSVSGGISSRTEKFDTSQYASRLERSLLHTEGIVSSGVKIASGNIASQSRNGFEGEFSEQKYKEQLSARVSSYGPPGSGKVYSEKPIGMQASTVNFSASEYRKKLIGEIERNSSSISSDSTGRHVRFVTKVAGPSFDTAGAAREVGKITEIRNAGYMSSDYINSIKKRIYDNWKRPGINLIIKETKAVVSFRIHSDGSVSNILVEKTSGYPEFDQSVIQAVKSSSPFPGFIKPGPEYINVTIEFSGKGAE